MMVRKPASSTSSFLLLIPVLLLSPFLSSAQTTTSPPPLQTQTFAFGSFNSTNKDKFSVLKDASVNGGALQLTPDTRNNVPHLLNKSGRAIFSQPFKLWDGDHNGSSSLVVASFNTSFDVNIFRDPNVTVVGEGLAFVIVPDLNDPPPGSEGGYLGLTNSTTDGKAFNQLIAVELDTFKQSYDPDDNHIGLNINSVVSNVTVLLTNSSIVLSPVNAANYTVWIDYNGNLRRIKVYIDKQSKPKPKKPVLEANLDLSNHLSQYSYFGFAGSTGDKYYELNCILSWSLAVEIIPENNDSEIWEWVLKAGVPILVALIILLFVLVWLRKRKRRREDGRRIGITLKELPGMPKEFKYKDLKKATGNFDEKNRLGQGGFGVVYRGRMGTGEAAEVAVKTFSRESSHGDFLAELTIINRLRHKHLVRLLGWCYKNGKLLLVYEYMPNCSLDRHLFNVPIEKSLPWNTRYKILAGVASALHYLHYEYEQKVVHRDLKASNIMLDSAFNARLGDFGLARAIDNERTSYKELDGMPGTWGYIAPECLHTNKATCESDVYGFGAVVLEVVCGRRPEVGVGEFQLLADWVWMLYREGRIMEAVDWRFRGEFVAEEAERLLLLGLACSHPVSAERPNMQAIVHIISKSVPPPPVPHFKPAFVWPAMPPAGVYRGESSSSAGNGTSSSAT